MILITNGSVFLSSFLSLHFTGTTHGLGLGGIVRKNGSW